MSEDIIKSMDIFHNFINPHMSLNGKTPAEMAGIDINLGRNRLLGLIFFPPDSENCFKEEIIDERRYMPLN